MNETETKLKAMNERAMKLKSMSDFLYNLNMISIVLGLVLILTIYLTSGAFYLGKLVAFSILFAILSTMYYNIMEKYYYKKLK